MLRVPESGLTLTKAPRHDPPTRGQFESDSSRDTRLFVVVGKRRFELRAWCRVDVIVKMLKSALALKSLTGGMSVK